MIAQAEELFGPYEWDRYDMLVLPPSFPYGGMENPRMTFLTPTLLAGDRSLVDVVAHELAHSWTGNLVTNADMEHFWLNEGFTVWAERRLLEALHGEEAAVLAWAIGEKALEESMERFGTGSPLTRLRTELAGIDPDDAFSSVPYEKGARFVALLERTAGRAAVRPLHARLHGPLPLHLDHDRGVPRPSSRSELPGLAAAGGRAGVALRARAARRTPPSSARRELDAPRGPRPRPSPGASGPAPPRSPAGRPPRRSSTSRTCPARSTRPGCAWLDAAMGLTGAGQPRDPRRVADRRRGLRLRARLPAAARGPPAVGRMKYLRPLYGGAGPARAHARPRPRGLRRGRAPLPRAVAPRGRLRHREVPRRSRLLSPRAP